MDIFSENDIPKLYFINVVLINVINVSVMIIDIFTNALF